MRHSHGKLRIGMVCFSTFGGSGVVATSIGMALGQRGHHVFFLSDKLPARLSAECPNVTYHPIDPLDHPLLAEHSYGMALTSKMLEIANLAKLDLFHLHYAFPHAVSAFLARQVLTPNAPKIVTTLHGTDVSVVGSNPKYKPLSRFVVEGSDAITAPSQWLAECAYEGMGLSRNVPIEVIPNFVDSNLFKPQIDLEAAPLGEPSRIRVLTHVSNFRPLKRIEDVVRIFAAIHAQMPSRLDLIGDGPDRPKGEQLATSLGLRDHVRFWGERTDLITLLQGSDLFLLPSDNESFGLAALEAMACSVPVLASNVGGLPEVVEHGKTGYLSEVGDISAMANYAQQLLYNEPLRRKMAAEARRVAVTKFQLDPAVDRYEAIYKRVLGEG